MSERMVTEHSGAIAWGVLLSSVAAWDYFAPPHQTLSESMDRALMGRWRALAIGAVAVTSLHLLNTFEAVGLERYDPIHQLANKIRKPFE